MNISIRARARTRFSGAVLAAALTVSAITLAACDGTNSSATADAASTSSLFSDNAEYAPVQGNPDPADDSENNRPEAIAEKAFLNVLNDSYITGEQNELIDIGYQQCLQISKGYTPQAMVYDWTNTGDTGYPGYSGADMSMITGAAIGALCPEHQHYLN